MREHVVKVADYAVDQGDVVLVTRGLGSCVAVALYDAGTRAGALAHILLPSITMARDQSNPAKFPETAIPLLVERLRELGAAPERLSARLVGGASMFASAGAPGAQQVGDRNVAAARSALAAAGVPVVAEDTGKGCGRSVSFYLGDGRLEVRTVAHGVRQL